MFYRDSHLWAAGYDLQTLAYSNKGYNTGLSGEAGVFMLSFLQAVEGKSQ